MAISNVMTKSLVSASSAMKQIKAQQGIKKQMEGKAGVLKAEIKQDSGRGGDTVKKEVELAAVEKKATDIGNMQMNQMAEMNKNMNEASKADAEEQKRAEKLEEQREKKRAERKEHLEELQEKAAMDNEANREPELRKLSEDIDKASSNVPKMVCGSHFGNN